MIRQMLSDGEWHDRASILHRIISEIDPHLLSRTQMYHAIYKHPNVKQRNIPPNREWIGARNIMAMAVQGVLQIRGAARYPEGKNWEKIRIEIHTKQDKVMP
jgi:HD superfamily phosphohydrolase